MEGKLMKPSGFTLIELMIVLAIVAIITAISVPNLMRSRMAANETSALASCKALGTAQEIYRRTDWDGNGILEYAQNIGPNGGNGNGESLYMNVAKNIVIELVDQSYAFAEGDPGAPNVNPRSGYCFKLQLAATVPNNINFITAAGNMTGGYGMSAVPLGIQCHRDQ